MYFRIMCGSYSVAITTICKIFKFSVAFQFQDIIQYVCIVSQTVVLLGPRKYLVCVLRIKVEKYLNKDFSLYKRQKKKKTTLPSV